jgi:YD repeat-containing protein
MSDQITTVSAQDLLGSFGVNTHSGVFDNDAYVNASLVIRSLDYLGISTVRDNYRSDGVPGQVLQAMADAGITFDFVAGNTLATNGSAGIQSFVNSVAAFASTNPGSVIAIEGQNEVDLFGTNYAGDTSLAAAAKIQQILYTDVKANAALSGVSVYNMALGREANYASLGNLSAYSDYANAHFYAGAASDVATRFANSISLAEKPAQGQGFVVTETGFTTSTAAAGIAVNELAQAKMTLTDLLMAYANGSEKSYVYQLLDTPTFVNTIATSQAAETAFGLFNADGSPKLAATALHNFSTLLNDTGGTAVAGTYQVSGLGTDGHTLSVNKSAGGNDLVIWRDVSSWSTATNSAVAVAAKPVTVTFSSVQAHVYVYSPLDGVTPIATYSNVSSITLPVSDTPLIVELGSSHPYTATPLVATNPTLTIDTTNFIAQIDTLSKTSGISSVKLTDSHVLEVASIETMKDILANYGSVLAKISGGFSFVLENAGSTYKIDTAYDQAGKLVSTSNYSLVNGAVTGLNVTWVSGATDHYSYTGGVIADETHIAADGSRSTITYNAGRAVQRVDISVTNVTTTAFYDAASGAVQTKTVFNADKSGDVWHYGITGKSYVSDHYVYSAGNTLVSVTRLHADGSRDYYEQHNSDGSLLQDFYSASGAISQEVRTAANGATASTTYDSAGRMVQDISTTKVTSTWAYSASGTILNKTVFNADKSGDVWHYGITGATYTSDHYVYSAGNVLASLTRLHADGSRDYYEQRNADGSKLSDYYNAAGMITQEVRVAANGAIATTTYDSAGRMIQDISATKVTSTWTYDASGDLATKMVFNADKSGTVSHYGISGKTYTSDQYVYSAGNVLSSLTRLHADGSRDYYELHNADGSSVTDFYSTKGVLTQDIRIAANGSSSTLNYDGAGRLTQRQDISSTKTNTTWLFDAASGATLTKSITDADKSGIVWHYGITGKTYTSDQTVYLAGGAVYSVIRLHADGSRDYYEQHNANGSTLFDYYSTAGKLTQEIQTAANGSRSIYSFDSAGRISQRQDTNTANSVTTWSYDTSGAVQTKTIVAADKSGDVWHYGITGKTYTSDHIVYSAGNVLASVTRNHADGTLDYLEQHQADGSTVKNYYNSAGVITQKVLAGTDGGSSVRSYDAAGHTTVQVDTSAQASSTIWTFDPASGELKSKTVTNADKSGEQYHYGITGQAYTSDHYTLSAGGAVQTLSRYHADGTLDFYQQNYTDGSKLLAYYDAAGNKTLEATTAANGAKSFHAYSEVTDQDMTSGRLLAYSSLTGSNLKIAGTPTVNLTDGHGHVIGTVDASDYSITNGMLMLDAHAVAGQLATGAHAYVDVTYNVTDGSTTAPTSVYSIQIDGTGPIGTGPLQPADSTANASTPIDTIYGDAGNNILDASGAHILIGGKGDDVYFVNDASTKIVELQGAGEGYDIVYSSVSQNLFGTFVEELRLTGAANIDATGNSQINTLMGNSGDNVLNGMGGDDILFGRGGNDTFVFGKAGHATIGDFDTGDSIDLSAFLATGKTASLSQTADGTLVTIDTGTSILVEGLAMSHLIKDSGGFHFG